MWSWANHVLDDETGLNIVLFSSGWGNGQYKTYWGLDARGAALCLMTDFQVLG
jgi:siroheme synthase